MGLVELFLVAVGLAMDAFAVSICKGLSLGKIKFKHMLIAGLWFGGFQALIPAVGYAMGSLLADKIVAVDHWVAFGLLFIIGVGMIRESFNKEEEMDSCMGIRCMLLLAVATSIDDLAVGVSFAFLKVSIFRSVLCIGGVTFVMSALGVKIGSVFGTKYKSKAEFTGGVVLILIGTKILLEHLGFI